MTSRGVALAALCELADRREPLGLILEPLLREHGVRGRDAGLVNSLVMGVLRQQDYLDWIVARFSRHPLAKMRPRTLIALRLGVYQLLCMDRIPSSAAVNETVAAFKAGRQPAWLVRVVNGILRNVAREREGLPSPAEAVRKNPDLLNHPAWLTRRWQHHFGKERCRRICLGNNEEVPLTLRVNTRLTDPGSLQALFAAAEITTLPGRYSEVALVLPEYHGEIRNLPGYEEGLFVVQDEAAQLAAMLLAPVGTWERVLDGSAGLGGKTTHLAAMLPADAGLTAGEPDQRRYQLLGENLDRLQMEGVATVNAGLEGFAASTERRFTAIFLDVPCSGTGVIRRRPDIRWNRREGDLAALRKRQQRLLRTAAALLAPGGRLVYATCSLEPEENEEMVEEFLAENPDFRIRDARHHLPAAAAELVTDRGYFQPLPDQGLDGFFAALLLRDR
jgi:16S rRNA (cytosine967-C5)-methyltransferase